MVYKQITIILLMSAMIIHWGLKRVNAIDLYLRYPTDLSQSLTSKNGVPDKLPLANRRIDVLLSDDNPNRRAEEIRKIIGRCDTTRVLDSLYFGIMNDSGTKFISFFACKRGITGFGENPIQLDSLHGQHINFCSYVMCGVEYNNKWYVRAYGSNSRGNVADQHIERILTIYNTLNETDFFIKGSTAFNPDFWETHFFKRRESYVSRNQEKIKKYRRKMERSKSAEERERYRQSIDRLNAYDKSNHEYIGLYDIVVGNLAGEKKKGLNQFEDSLSKELITPFFDTLIARSDPEITEYIKHYSRSGYRFTQIYPTSKHVILCPIGLIDQKDTMRLHYYVFLKDSSGAYNSFKWTYSPPKMTRFSRAYNYDLAKQLGSLPGSWNFSDDTLDDDEFWQNYVLKKENNTYSYLSRINWL